MVEEDIYDKLPSIELFLESAPFLKIDIFVSCASDGYSSGSQTKI